MQAFFLWGIFRSGNPTHACVTAHDTESSTCVYSPVTVGDYCSTASLSVLLSLGSPAARSKMLLKLLVSGFKQFSYCTRYLIFGRVQRRTESNYELVRATGEASWLRNTILCFLKELANKFIGNFVMVVLYGNVKKVRGGPFFFFLFKGVNA